MLIELTCQHQYPPVQKSPGDVGADLRLFQSEKFTPREITPIKTGVFVQHIKPGFWAKLETKSRAAKNGLIVVGGVIDQGYRGEIVALVLNSQKHQVVMQPGEAIAQLIVMPMFEPCESICVDGALVDVLTPEQRGAKGGVWR